MHDKLTILLATEDTALEEGVLSSLRGEDRRIHVSGGLKRALRLLEQGDIDLLLIDGAFPKEGMTRLVQTARESRYRVPVYALANADALPDQVEVDGTIGRPPDADRLAELMARAEARWDFVRNCRLLGSSDRMREVREKVEQIAPTDVSVLITGESGTGKDLVANAIHRYSRRATKPFRVINCGAIPETLLESELFGHERGAFTDARTQRKGLFEAADGGTVFLDEIGEMTASAQVKLLRVLEEREVTRLGSSHTVPVDVRVLAATNRELGLAARRGEFRRDLYYRLNVVEIRMPALRERAEDIPELAEAFTAEHAKTHGMAPPRIDPEAMRSLCSYSWPGNVRELKNLVERLIVLSKGSAITSRDVARHLDVSDAAAGDHRNLPVPLHKTPGEAQWDLIYWVLLALQKELAEVKAFLMGGGQAQGRVPYPGPPVRIFGEEVRVEEAAVEEPTEAGGRQTPLRSLAEVEREYIEQILKAVGGNRRHAADILGIGERTIYRKIKEHRFS